MQVSCLIHFFFFFYKCSAPADSSANAQLTLAHSSLWSHKGLDTTLQVQRLQEWKMKTGSRVNLPALTSVCHKMAQYANQMPHHRKLLYIFQINRLQAAPFKCINMGSEAAFRGVFPEGEACVSLGGGIGSDSAPNFWKVVMKWTSVISWLWRQLTAVQTGSVQPLDLKTSVCQEGARLLDV